MIAQRKEDVITHSKQYNRHSTLSSNAVRVTRSVQAFLSVGRKGLDRKLGSRSRTLGIASSNRCHASSNRCLTSSNKKLLVTCFSHVPDTELQVLCREANRGQTMKGLLTRCTVKFAPRVAPRSSLRETFGAHCASLIVCTTRDMRIHASRVLLYHS